MPIAKVEPLTTARALRGPFDYRLPERLGEVGRRQRPPGAVRAPAGARRRGRGRRVERAAARAARGADRRPWRRGRRRSSCGSGLWVAREYCSTPARGLELVLPPGVGTDGQAVGPAARAHGRADRGRAARRLDDGTRLGRAPARRARGAGRRGRPAVSSRRPSSRPAPASTRETLKRLEARGLVALRSRERRRRPSVAAVGAPSHAPRLSTDQRSGRSAEIVAAIDGGRERELLLHGVTGSGKTEVYLAAAEAALERGRGSIVLVPEIALTPQIVARFAARFGDRVALLHSRLRARASAATSGSACSPARRGSASGPRSAIFAPVARSGPGRDRRGARRLLQAGGRSPLRRSRGRPAPGGRKRRRARRRQRHAPAGELAGAAAARAARSRRRPAAPAGRAGRPAGALAPGRARSIRGRSRRSPRSPTQRAKAIVLLNRRGWSPFLTCRSCGRAWSCPHCDVSLVIHKARRDPERRAGRFAVTTAATASTRPASCPDCGSVALARHGVGTERLATLLGEAAAPLPVFRLDSDSAARVGGHLRDPAALRRRRSPASWSARRWSPRDTTSRTWS